MVSFHHMTGNEPRQNDGRYGLLMTVIKSSGIQIYILFYLAHISDVFYAIHFIYVQSLIIENL